MTKDQTQSRHVWAFHRNRWGSEVGLKGWRKKRLRENDVRDREQGGWVLKKHEKRCREGKRERERWIERER